MKSFLLFISIVFTSNSFASFVIPDKSIVQQKLANKTVSASPSAGGFAVSSLVSSFTTSSTSPVTVTGLTVTLTTTGRPVMVGLTTSTSGGASSADVSATAASSGGLAGIKLDILNGSTQIYSGDFQGTAAPTVLGLEIPASSFLGFDFPTAGTYTYTVKLRVTFGSSAGIFNTSLYAFEL